MKDKCDNHCETCPMQRQVYCSLIFSKATNTSLSVLDERLAILEQAVLPKEVTLINPMQEASFCSDFPNQEGEDMGDEGDYEDNENIDVDTKPQNPISVNPSTPEVRVIPTKH